METEIFYNKRTGERVEVFDRDERSVYFWDRSDAMAPTRMGKARFQQQFVDRWTPRRGPSEREGKEEGARGEREDFSRYPTLDYD